MDCRHLIIRYLTSRVLHWRRERNSSSSLNRPIRSTITSRRGASWADWERRRYSMLRNSHCVEVKNKKEKVKTMKTSFRFAFLLLPFVLLTACGVRFDMQDQPRYKA